MLEYPIINGIPAGDPPPAPAVSETESKSSFDEVCRLLHQHRPDLTFDWPSAEVAREATGLDFQDSDVFDAALVERVRDGLEAMAVIRAYRPSVSMLSALGDLRGLCAGRADACTSVIDGAHYAEVFARAAKKEWSVYVRIIKDTALDAEFTSALRSAVTAVAKHLAETGAIR